jgi:hypothetical protein
MNTTDTSATTGAAPAVHRARLRHHPLFGGLLVKEGLINQTQLEHALALQQETAPRPLLGQVLLEQRLVTPHELNSFLDKYQRKHLLGDVLIETKAITPVQLEAALDSQRRTDRSLGDTLIQLGFITERQLKQALGIQLRIPFVDLDKAPIDPGMRTVLSESYARHNRVVPMSRLDDRIVLAMDDPTDLDVIAEVRACTGHRIDLVTATADAVERALFRLYGEPGDARPTVRSQAVEPLAGPGPPLTERGPLAPAVQDQTPGSSAGTPGGGDHAPHRTGGAARSGVAIEAIRARLDAIRSLARSWERSIHAVEGLIHERSQGQAEIDQLSGELRESRAALADANQELEARGRALAALEASHAAVLRERDALDRALADLREQHASLLRDREFAIDHVSEALRRLRS